MGGQLDNQGSAARRSYFVGISLLLAAAVLWSLSGALIKLIGAGGSGPGGVVIAFYRSLFAGLFLIPFAWGRLRAIGPPRAERRGLSIRSSGLLCVIFFAAMTVCFVVANTQTEAANAIILQYTSTFWVFGLSPWVLREHPRPGDIRLLLLAGAGIAIIFVGNATTDLLGLLNALGAGLFFGLLTLMLRRLRDVDPAAVTLFNNLGSALLILPVAALLGGLMVSGRELALLVTMGVVQFGLPYYLYTLGLARVPAPQAALITMVEPVLVPVWAYVAVGETISISTVVGGGVILVALALFILAARRAHR